MTTTESASTSKGLPDLLQRTIRVGDGALKILTLNRPARRNALDTALLSELLGALRDAGCDRQVRAVIIAGNGPSFCGGGDLKEFSGSPDPLPGISRRSALHGELQSLIPKLSIPVVAAVHGSALGAGAALTLAADMMVMSTDASIGFPELQDGVVPGMVTAIAVRRFGAPLAFDLLSTGHRLTALEMSHHGLARIITEPERIVDAAVDLARVWAALPRESVTEAKKLVQYASTHSLYEANAAGLDAVNRTWDPGAANRQHPLTERKHTS